MYGFDEIPDTISLSIVMYLQNKGPSSPSVKLSNLRIEAIKDALPHLIATQDDVGSVAMNADVKNLASLGDNSKNILFTYAGEWGPVSTVF